MSLLTSLFTTIRHTFAPTRLSTAPKVNVLPQRQLYAFEGHFPYLGQSAKYMHSSQIIGQVDLLDGAAVWYNAVVRGDKGPVQIGFNTTIGDRAVIIGAKQEKGTVGHKTTIGSFCVIGKGAVVENAQIEDFAVVGAGSYVSKGSMIEQRGMLARNSVLAEGDRILPGQLWRGNPAKFERDLTQEEKEKNYMFSQEAMELIDYHNYDSYPMIDPDLAMDEKEGQALLDAAQIRENK